MNQSFSWIEEQTIEVERTETIKDIYGKELEDIKIPKGYKAVEFRKMKFGDRYWLNSLTSATACDGTLTTGNDIETPRIILEKVPVYQLANGEQPRLPVAGDYIIHKKENKYTSGWTEYIMPVTYGFVEDKHFIFEKVED
jgi:hypothetical protein